MTTDQSTDTWRGVATEDEDEVDAGLSAFMRRAVGGCSASSSVPNGARSRSGSFLVVVHSVAGLATPLDRRAERSTTRSLPR